MSYGRQLALLPSPIDVDFVEFHHANPSVYAELVALARAQLELGNRVGIGCLWETLRYNRALDGVRDSSGVKLNNNYRSRYARLIMATEADLAGYFDVRCLRSDDAA